jgi:acetyl esterase/lipase
LTIRNQASYWAILAALIVAPSAAFSAEPTEPVPGVLLETDVQYGAGGGVPLHMDIARPRGGDSSTGPRTDGPFPAVVFIHGGGWRGGDKAVYRGAILGYAAAGYIAASVQYRFAPAHAWPAQIEDVKCAVRYLRSRARDLNLDPDRIGATGGSAGGHLALMLGMTDEKAGLEGHGGHAQYSSRVQAVASLAGPADLRRMFPDLVEAMLSDLVGGSRDQRADGYRSATPLTYLSPDDPPVLAIHGTVDALVPYEQATSLLAACEKAGVEASLVTIPDGNHGSGGRPEDWHAANMKMLEFFNRHLKK